MSSASNHQPNPDFNPPIQPQTSLPSSEPRSQEVQVNTAPSKPQKPTLAEGLAKLKQEFAEIRAIADPIERDYQLIQCAKASDIDTQEYRELFAAYQRRTAQGVHAVWHAFLYAAEFFGKFTIVLGLLLYILQADTREQETYTQAWQTITSVSERTDNAGRIQALQTLSQGCRFKDVNGEQQRQAETDTIAWLDPQNWFGGWWQQIDLREAPLVGGFLPNCVSLRGLDVRTAHLPEVNLEFAELKNARLQRTGLWGANLKGAELQGALLEQAILNDADMKGANLTRASLKSAELRNTELFCLSNVPNNREERCVRLDEADLTGAILDGANLTGASLKNADLTNATLGCSNLPNNTKRCADLTGATLDGADLEGANLQETEGLTVAQVQAAANWDLAQYSDEFRQQLGLPPITPRRPLE